MLDQIMLVEHDPATPESLVKEAAQGHADIVQEIITKYPDQVRKRLSSHIQSPIRYGRAPHHIYNLRSGRAASHITYTIPSQLGEHLPSHAIPGQTGEHLSSHIQSPVRQGSVSSHIQSLVSPDLIDASKPPIWHLQ